MGDNLENSKSSSQQQGEAQSAQSDMDRFFDKLDSKERQAELEKEIFIQRDDFSDTVKQKGRGKFKDLAWYIDKFAPQVITLAALEVLIYVLAIFPVWRVWMEEVVSPLLWLVYLFFLGWLFSKIRVDFKEGLWQATVTVFLAGLSLGILIAIFKLIWFHEYWTIFNLIIEPMVLALLGAGIGMIINLFIRKSIIN